MIYQENFESKMFEKRIRIGREPGHCLLRGRKATPFKFILLQRQLQARSCVPDFHSWAGMNVVERCNVERRSAGQALASWRSQLYKHFMQARDVPKTRGYLLFTI